MINIMGYNRKENIDIYLVCVLIATKCNHQMSILHPVYKLTLEFSMHFSGLNRWFINKKIWQLNWLNKPYKIDWT